MGMYAGLGLAYSFFSFCGTFLLFMSGVRASYNLFNYSLNSVMQTSVGWHDRTPVSSSNVFSDPPSTCTKD